MLENPAVSVSLFCKHLIFDWLLPPSDKLEYELPAHDLCANQQTGILPAGEKESAKFFNWLRRKKKRKIKNKHWAVLKASSLIVVPPPNLSVIIFAPDKRRGQHFPHQQLLARTDLSLCLWRKINSTQSSKGELGGWRLQYYVLTKCAFLASSLRGFFIKTTDSNTVDIPKNERCNKQSMSVEKSKSQ